MSNLVKQYFVVRDQGKDGPVVINSNRKMEEHLKRLAREREEQEQLMIQLQEQEEFKEGLNLEAVNVLQEEEQTVMKASFDEIVKEANEEAKRIIAEATEEASRILREAKENATLIYEEQKKEGYLAGEQQVQEEIATARLQLEKQQDDLQMQLQEQYVQKLSGMEKDITEAIIQVFDHVFRLEFAEHRDVLLYLVDAMVQNIPVGKHIKIYTSSEDLMLVESHMKELCDKLGQDVEIELLYDASLFAGGCRIETETGVFDCSVDTELSNIYKNIRMICG